MINPNLDKDFLSLLDESRNKEIWAKIVALDINENPVEEITGSITADGSINIDGTSAVRRSCSFTMVSKNVDITSYYWGLKSKFKLFIGVTNDIDSNYDKIIWFPQGIYLISSFSTSQNTNNYTISIQGKDKMCMLNGELGGALNAQVDFGKYDEEQPKKDKNGNKIIKTKNLPIKQIIREAVHQYAKEPLQNIIINDIDDYGLQLLEYRGKKPLYIFIKEEKSESEQRVLNIAVNDKLIYKIHNNVLEPIKLSEIPEEDLNNLSDFNSETGRTYAKFSFFSNSNLEGSNTEIFSVVKIEYGEVVGYRMTELIYPGDLILNAGEPLTALFDKLVQMLGNFEYFYDIDGNFVFQAKPTYIQETWNPIAEDEMHIDIEKTKYSYEFGKSKLINAFSNSPSLTSLRNDFSIWGNRKTISGANVPIHLRYALDYKPFYYKNIEGKIFCTEEGLKKVKLKKDEKPIIRDWRELIFQMASDYRKNSNKADFLYQVQENNKVFINKEELMLYPSGKTGYEHYYIDLEGFWRQLYNPQYEPEWNTIIEPNENNKMDYVPRQIKVQTYKCITDKDKRGDYDVNSVFLMIKQENKIDVQPFVNETTCSLDPKYIYYKKDGTKLGTKSSNFEDNFEKAQIRGYDSVYIKNEKKELVWWPQQAFFDYPIAMSKDVVTGELILSAGLFVETDDEEHFLSIQTFIDGVGVNDIHYSVIRFLKNLYIEDEKSLTYHPYYYTQINEEGIDPYEKKVKIKYFIQDNYYNLKEDSLMKYWHNDAINDPQKLNFWFDFMDNMGSISKYSIPAVGQRSKVVNDSNVKAIYFGNTPKVIFECLDSSEEDNSDWIVIEEKDKRDGYTYVNIPVTMLSSFVVSAQGQSANTLLKERIYNDTYCTESISINSIPIYYLQPNTVIYIRDYDSKIDGEYIVNRLTIPLNYSGIMSISAIKMPESIY